MCVCVCVCDVTCVICHGKPPYLIFEKWYAQINAVFRWLRTRALNFWDLKVLNNLCIHFTPIDLRGFDCLLANRLIYVIITL